MDIYPQHKCYGSAVWFKLPSPVWTNSIEQTDWQTQHEIQPVLATQKFLIMNSFQSGRGTLKKIYPLNMDFQVEPVWCGFFILIYQYLTDRLANTAQNSACISHSQILNNEFISERKGNIEKNLSIEYVFPSGTHFMQILRIHLMIYSPECIKTGECALDYRSTIESDIK